MYQTNVGRRKEKFLSKKIRRRDLRSEEKEFRSRKRRSMEGMEEGKISELPQAFEQPLQGACTRRETVNRKDNCNRGILYFGNAG